MSVTDLYYLDADMQVVLEKGISNSEDQYPTFSFKKNHQIHTNECNFDNYPVFPLLTFLGETIELYLQ